MHRSNMNSKFSTLVPKPVLGPCIGVIVIYLFQIWEEFERICDGDRQLLAEQKMQEVMRTVAREMRTETGTCVLVTESSLNGNYCGGRP